MKEVWTALILTTIVLAGCGIVTFNIPIPESEEIILDTKVCRWCSLLFWERTY
jgi:nitrous oxide reductase accessory protein NosL